LVQLPTLGVTSIGERTKLNDLLSVYPNPFNTDLNIKNSWNSAIEITISDINGKLVYRQKSNLELIQVNTSELSNGLYILNVKNNESESNYKLVK
ncbi:MAG TPA: T9SS type A sorting domain-containing protein, partial [Bacteroidia bacterium]|nr:T9SS type A sorting domain-containing protein [Bacteroidia bacterium]